MCGLWRGGWCFRWSRHRLFVPLCDQDRYIRSWRSLARRGYSLACRWCSLACHSFLLRDYNGGLLHDLGGGDGHPLAHAPGIDHLSIDVKFLVLGNLELLVLSVL